MNTFEPARSIQSGHGAPYVQRAREALPVLVQFASAGRTVSYATLAHMLSMPNPRNLNYVLGSIGATLEELSRGRRPPIPPLQSIVVNSSSGTPGSGFDAYLKRRHKLEEIAPGIRRALLRDLHSEVWGFSGWASVLRDLGLPARESFACRAKRVLNATQPLGDTGESEAHLSFKRWLLSQPQLFGLAAAVKGIEEADLPSGDRIDVVFRTPRRVVGVEAKSSISPEQDLIRGIFQCVKYAAVLKALTRWEGERSGCSVFLTLEGSATQLVREAAALLGVKLLEKARSRGR